jgi:hypothetical protein
MAYSYNLVFLSEFLGMFQYHHMKWLSLWCKMFIFLSHKCNNDYVEYLLQKFH